MSALFDEYSLRARVYPGLLTALPVVTTILLIWPGSGLKALWPVFVGVGGVFFLANVVRTRGRRLEAELIRQWDGLPTTHMLRYRDSNNAPEFERRRRGVARVFGEPLPDQHEESVDPAKADDVYIAATRVLITRVRDDPTKYPRVHEENIHYGFRRNLLALKPVGLVLVLTVILIDAAVAISAFGRATLVALAIDLLVALGWIALVTREWVLDSARTYAIRLFETLDQDGLTGR